MAKTKPEAVIFDWDGVLCDSNNTHKKIREVLSPEFGYLTENSHGKSAREFLVAKGADGATIAKYFEQWENLEKQFGASAFPDAAKTLVSLKIRGILCGALSNRGPYKHNFRTFAESGLNLNLLSFFILYNSPAYSGVYGEEFYDETSRFYYQLSPFRKPDKSAVLPVQDLLMNCPGYPNSVLCVGDNIIDLEFARANGFKFVGVLSGDINEPSEWRRGGLDFGHGDMIIKDIGELLKII